MGRFKLQAIFHQGLIIDILTKLACHDDDTTLETLIEMAIRLDHLLQDRKSQVFFVSKPKLSPPEPMQLGRAQITPTERMRRHNERLCYYCGQGQHRAAERQAKSCPKADLVSSPTTSCHTPPR